jgi:hypothetical protein
VDAYTTLPWETLCKEVLCLKVDLHENKGVSSSGVPEKVGTDLVTPLVTPDADQGA